MLMRFASRYAVQRISCVLQCHHNFPGLAAVAACSSLKSSYTTSSCTIPSSQKRLLHGSPRLGDRDSQKRLLHGSPRLGDRDEAASRALLTDFKQTFSLPRASHQISKLNTDDVGKEVLLHGYLGARSDLSKSISFVSLVGKDLKDSVQIVSVSKAQDSNSVHHAKLKSLTQHSPVAVKGTVKVKQKPKGQQRVAEVKRNEDYEISMTELYILNEFPSDVTFQEDTNIPLEQRHLQLRQSAELRDALRFRARASNVCRQYLADEHAFIEIETPLLFKSTPEGAREFLVPTRTKGMVYALPQSPQQYKQILMASGVPRYFQLAKCFRDEDQRADRQPEFTQLDLEMSFATGSDVMGCIEGLVRRLWKSMLDTELHADPFTIMPYEDAMATYGSDKPDLRLGMEISLIGHLIPVDLVNKIGPLTNPIVEVFKFSVSDDPATTRKFVFEFMDSIEAQPFINNPDGQPGIFIYDSRKPLGGLQPFGFEAAEHLEETQSLQEGDLLILQARKNAPFSGGSTPIGNLRLALHRFAVAKSLVPAPTGWQFLWINQFPLFTPTNDVDPGQGGSAGLSATHHPFTAPASAADIDLLATSPLTVRADHYDLVLNGVELGGGSRRIHSAAFQKYILRDVLRVSEERMQDFAHLIEVLRMGCPPHAGLAIGFDRLMATMLGKESIRDVIAFPKSQGRDLLVRSPGRITEEQLETYGLALRK